MKQLWEKINEIRQNKIVKAVLCGLNIITTLVVVVLLVIIFVQRFSDNNISLGGYSIYTVVSGSMEPEYKIGDMLLVRDIDCKNISVNDNIVYIGNESNLTGKIITHKVIRKSEKDGVVHFVTKGTANQIEDPEITENQVLGKVQFKFVLLSLIGRLVNSSYGFYFIIFVPFVIFCFIEFIDIKKEVEKEKEE